MRASIHEGAFLDLEEPLRKQGTVSVTRPPEPDTFLMSVCDCTAANSRGHARSMPSNSFSSSFTKAWTTDNPCSDVTQPTSATLTGRYTRLTLTNCPLCNPNKALITAPTKPSTCQLLPTFMMIAPPVHREFKEAFKCHTSSPLHNHNSMSPLHLPLLCQTIAMASLGSVLGLATSVPGQGSCCQHL